MAFNSWAPARLIADSSVDPQRLAWGIVVIEQRPRDCYKCIGCETLVINQLIVVRLCPSGMSSVRMLLFEDKLLTADKKASETTMNEELDTKHPR